MNKTDSRSKIPYFSRTEFDLLESQEFLCQGPFQGAARAGVLPGKVSHKPRVTQHWARHGAMQLQQSERGEQNRGHNTSRVFQ